MIKTASREGSERGGFSARTLMTKSRGPSPGEAICAARRSTSAIVRGSGRGKAAGHGDGREIDAAPGVARLHPGLAEMLVVDHDDVEIARARDANGGETPEAHQLLAVAGQSENALSGLSLRQSKPDQRGAAHRAPEIKIAIVVADGMKIIGRGAETGDDQRVLAVPEKRSDSGTAIELSLH